MTPNHRPTDKAQRPITHATTQAPQNLAPANPLQHGAIGLAAVAAAAQQIKPKAIKRPDHPLPACLRDQD